MVKRAAAFLLVFVGSAILGWNIHNVGQLIAGFVSLGFPEVTAFFKSINPNMFSQASGSMGFNAFLMWFNPVSFLYLWLLIHLWRDGDMFKTLLALAVTHSVHAFVFMQIKSPLSGSALAAGIILLIVSELITIALSLWWRHVRLTTPVYFPE